MLAHYGALFKNGMSDIVIKVCTPLRTVRRYFGVSQRLMVNFDEDLTMENTEFPRTAFNVSAHCERYPIPSFYIDFQDVPKEDTVLLLNYMYKGKMEIENSTTLRKALMHAVRFNMGSLVDGIENAFDFQFHGAVLLYNLGKTAFASLQS